MGERRENMRRAMETPAEGSRNSKIAIGDGRRRPCLNEELQVERGRVEVGERRRD